MHFLRLCIKGEGKAKVCPRTGREGPEGEWAPGGGGWSTPRPGRFSPGKTPGTHCTGGWVGLGAGLDGCGKFHSPSIRSLDRPTLTESLYRLSYRCPLYAYAYTHTHTYIYMRMYIYICVYSFIHQ
jgi:hypothetical protein